ncbi:Endoplasmin [Carex littledalei]|uniref:Endoplasmin n=1 Tax=Carex littledalei TaxID=544730 RepID=A0A833QZ14_9POAL|nr:Endoplasmin [Carex littledalei]
MTTGIGKGSTGTANTGTGTDTGTRSGIIEGVGTGVGTGAGREGAGVGTDTGVGTGTGAGREGSGVGTGTDVGTSTGVGIGTGDGTGTGKGKEEVGTGVGPFTFAILAFSLLAQIDQTISDFFPLSLSLSLSDASGSLRFKENAILSQALDKISFLVLGKGDTAKLEIQIKLDNENKVLSIRDRGIGMTKKDLTKNLSTIAKSGTSGMYENPRLMVHLHIENEPLGRGFDVEVLVDEEESCDKEESSEEKAASEHYQNRNKLGIIEDAHNRNKLTNLLKLKRVLLYYFFLVWL